jgi:hypothetical protein
MPHYERDKVHKIDWDASFDTVVEKRFAMAGEDPNSIQAMAGNTLSAHP